MTLALTPQHSATAVIGQVAVDTAVEVRRHWDSARSYVLQLARFAGVGSAGMGLYLAMYVLTAPVIGDLTANLAAWVVSTVITNAAHRRLTFGKSGVDGVGSDQLVSMLSCVVSLGLSTFALAVIPEHGAWVDIAALCAVNVVVGAGRFLVMRWWMVGRPAHRAVALAA